MGSSKEQHQSVDVGDYARRRRWWPLPAVAGALAIGAVGAVLWLGGDPNSDLDDDAATPDPPPGTRSAENDTALLYASWQRGIAASECAAERGEDFLPFFPNFDGDFDAVREYLGVTADDVDDVGDFIALVDYPPWYSLPESVGGCVPPIDLVDLNDTAAVDAAVAAARDDDRLREVLAVDAFAEDDPQAYLRLYVDEWVALERIAPAVDTEALQSVLDRIETAVDERTSAVLTSTDVIAAGPYAVGFWERGPLTIQVLDDVPGRDYWLAYIWGSPPSVARCDGAVVLVGTYPVVWYGFDESYPGAGPNPDAGSVPLEIHDLLPELGCERVDPPESG